MRAALIENLGQVPVAGELEECPVGDGMSRIRVLAAALNPVDLAIAGGHFYAGHPPFPYVPGTECVGIDEGGRTVYATGGGLGLARNGACAEYCAAPTRNLVEVPASVDPGMAAALGTAGVAGWRATTDRGRLKPGDIVAILGVTGTAGRIAAQAARAGGAARVIGIGRDPAKLADTSSLCDSTIASDDAQLGDLLMESSGGGVDLLIDFLWGEPLERVLPAVAMDGRIVHVGAAAGTSVCLPSSAVRGKRLDLLGYSNFGLDDDQYASTYTELVNRLDNGSLSIPVTSVPLSEIGRGWRGTRQSSGKYVVHLGDPHPEGKVIREA